MADLNTTFEAYALHNKDGKFEPWTYHPRILGEEDIEIEIDCCGICGSDIHTAFGGWGNVVYPIVVGHEIVGKVTKAGPKAIHKVGERVGVGAQCHACRGKSNEKCTPCETGNENHCWTDLVGTYNGKYKDGEWSKGGYAKNVRVDSYFAFKIPENLPSEVVAPLFCAGATVYSPLVEHGCSKGKKVGVVGLGGLGHLAVQFAHKLGAEVWAIGTSKKKEELAKQLGASGYIDINNAEEVAKYKAYFDIIIHTADGPDMPWGKLLSLTTWRGTYALVAIPDTPLSIPAFGILYNKIKFVGSAIGSRKEIKEMLEFASAHGVHPMIEVLPMSEVNEGIRKVRENDVKFRVVLKN